MQNGTYVREEEANSGIRMAIVISVSNYTNGKLQPLSFCKNDGQKIYELLNSLDYKIADNHKLIGEVKYETMRDAIIDFFTDVNIRASDTLLFYYSGHGIPDADGDIYFASSEIDPDAPYRKGFSFSELTKMVQRSVSIRIVTILDCCYSGAAKLSKGHEEDAAKLGIATIDNKAKVLQQGEGKCLLAASQAAQEAYALREGDHSIFTYYLLEGLKGNEKSVDAEGNITPYSLGSYIYKAILNLPATKRPKQKPITKVEASGDIILASYPDLAKSKFFASAITPSSPPTPIASYPDLAKSKSFASAITPSSPPTPSISKERKKSQKTRLDRKKSEKIKLDRKKSEKIKLKILIPVLIVVIIGAIVASKYIIPMIQSQYTPSEDIPKNMTKSAKALEIEFRSYVPVKAGEPSKSDSLSNLKGGQLWRIVDGYTKHGDITNFDPLTGNIIYKSHLNYKGSDSVLLTRINGNGEEIYAAVVCFLIDTPTEEREKYVQGCAYQYRPNVTISE